MKNISFTLAVFVVATSGLVYPKEKSDRGRNFVQSAPGIYTAHKGKYLPFDKCEIGINPCAFSQPYNDENIYTEVSLLYARSKDWIGSETNGIYENEN